MISLQTAKKLKDLGFNQETLLHFKDTDNGWAIILNDLNFPVEGSIAAPIFEDLWEQLPKYIVYKESEENYYEYYKTVYPHFIGYYNEDSIPLNVNDEDIVIYLKESIVESAASLWIKLKTNNLL